MSRSSKTGFDRYFEARMKNKAFAAAYAEARAEIDSIDNLMRALDDARVRGGLSKADLARKMETQPEAVRRLLTAEDANPTLGTVIKMARSMGYSLALVPSSRGGGRRRVPRLRQRAA